MLHLDRTLLVERSEMFFEMVKRMLMTMELCKDLMFFHMQLRWRQENIGTCTNILLGKD